MCCVQHCSDGKQLSSTLEVDYVDSATKGCDCIVIIRHNPRSYDPLSVAVELRGYCKVSMVSESK